MKFYIKQHKHYCGIDLHARSMYLCIIDSSGQVKLHKDIKTSPEALMKAIKPYLDDLVITVECMFSWYWVADFCEDNNIKFILGHALYMKAIQQRFLERKLRLTVNEKKSKTGPVEECGFLGFIFVRGKIRWSDKSFREFKRRIRLYTGRSGFVSMEYRFQKLAECMSGAG